MINTVIGTNTLHCESKCLQKKKKMWNNKLIDKNSHA